MRIRLEFDSNDVDDMHEYENMMAARKVNCVIFDYLDVYLRNKLKYEDLSDETYDAFEEAREKLVELINEHGVGDVLS